MKYNLFLDDIRQPSEVGNYMLPVELRPQYRLDKWEIVRNYEQFVEIIEKHGLPDKISFDHDLADSHYDPKTWTEVFTYGEKTGCNCAEWLCKYCHEKGLKFPEYYVHSMNPVGKENIIGCIEGYKNRIECEV